MISQLNPSAGPRSLSHKHPTMSPSPRHYPYSTRARTKRAPNSPQKYELTYTVSTDEQTEDEVHHAMATKVGEVQEDQLLNVLNSLEIYISRVGDGEVNEPVVTYDTDVTTTSASVLTAMDNMQYKHLMEQQIEPEIKLPPPALEPGPVQNHDQGGPVIAEVKGSDGEVITLNFDHRDEKVTKAAVQALNSGSLTPLVKEELRCAIQTRRLAEGKGEMQVEFKAPLKKKEMTEEERKRALKRRHQNKEAAQRFRQKQQDTSDYLTAKISRLQTNSETLQQTIESLRKEREELQLMLQNHLQICSRPAHMSTNIDIERLLTNSSVVTVPDCQSHTTQCLPSTSSESGYDSRSVSNLHLPSTNTASVASISYDSSIPESASTCPGTAESESVFFPDNEVMIPDSNHSFLNQTQRDQLLSLAEDYCFENTGLNDHLEECAPDVCYEEVVVDVNYAQALEEEEVRRLDSCSSVDNNSVCSTSYGGSVSPSLSESTQDLRHSLASAYSKVQLDPCDSVVFVPQLQEVKEEAHDLLLPE